jgi:predicted phosphodiesterase
MLKTSPAVFAVHNTYQIMVSVTKESLFFVKIGDKCYYDHSNGILRSLSPLHRVTVPMEELDKAGEYTVCVRPLIERKPYFTETEEVWEKTFEFYPVPEKNIRCYHLSDTHGHIENPTIAAKTFGKIDFLILNGDIIDHSGDPEKFDNIYQICANITGGNIPTVFSRGNHDLRGNFAERFADYTPSYQGKTYYTFRLGSVWGMLPDCGEDKADHLPNYGFTIACHPFRLEQTEWIKQVIENKNTEYLAPGVKTRLVISHVPFTEKHEEPFDIEEDTYALWAKLIKENIKPDLMICGHTHINEIRPLGHERDNFGQPCTLVVAAGKKADVITGTGFEFKENEIEVTFTNSNAEILEKNVIKK